MNKMYEEKLSEVHPSYGIAKFSRTDGGGNNFYGSVIKPQNYISFEIHRSKKEVSVFGEEHFYTDGRIPLIEIEMTASQFAELITTMNVGSGVPVTLKYIEGKRVEECPQQTSPLDNVTKVCADRTVSEGYDFVKENIEGVISKLKSGVLGKKSTFTKAGIEEMIRSLNMINGRLEANADFYQKQILEVGEKVTQQVRTEIENATSAVVNRLGLNALQSMGGKGGDMRIDGLPCPEGIHIHFEDKEKASTTEIKEAVAEEIREILSKRTLEEECEGEGEEVT